LEENLYGERPGFLLSTGGNVSWRRQLLGLRFLSLVGRFFDGTGGPAGKMVSLHVLLIDGL